MKTPAFLTPKALPGRTVVLGLGLLVPSIIASAMSVDLRVPIGGEVYISGGTMRIEWVCHFDPGESADNLNLQYAWAGSSTYRYIGSTLSSEIARGTFHWTVPIVSEVSYLRIKAGLYREDGHELACDTSYTVTILPSASTPSIYLVDPQPPRSGALALRGGAPYEIRWETTGCVSPHTTVPMTIEFSTSGFLGDWTEVAAVNPCSSDHYSWTVPEIATTHAYLRLRWGSLDQSSTLHPFTIYLTGPPNAAPVANAGEDFRIAELATAYLDGGESSDPEGGALRHAWSRADGLVASYPTTLVNADTATPHFTTPEAGDEPKTLTFQLTVTDPLGATDTDFVNVQVVPGVPVSTGFSPASGWFKTPVTLTGRALGGCAIAMHGVVVATVPDSMHDRFTFYLPDLPLGPSALTISNLAGSITTPSAFEVLPVPYQWDWGFSFHNPGGFLMEWDDYERAFGDAVNSLVCCEYEGLFCTRRCHDYLAQLIWDGFAHEMAMPGSCWGMSVASLKYSYADWPLAPGETVREQWFNLHPENELTRNIKALHLSQLSAETIGYLVDHIGDNPATVLGQVIADLDAGTPGVLSIQRVAAGMDVMDLQGHALVPVHYEEVSPGLTRVHVYDSNRESWSESRDNDDPSTFAALTTWESYPYLTIDTDGVQTWQFEMVDGALYNGDNRLHISVRVGDGEMTVPFSGLFYFPRSAAVRSHYTFPTSLPGILMILGGSADGSARDATGDSVGYDADGSLLFDIPGAVPLMPHGAASFRQHEAYLLPNGDYTVRLRGNESGEYHWRALNQDFAAVLDGVPCLPGREDVVRFSPSCNSLSLSPATDKATYGVQLLTSATENNLLYRRKFELHNLSLKAGQQAAFRVRPDRKSIALLNAGADVLSIDALLSQVQLSPQPEPPDLPAPEEVTLVAQQITLSPGSTTVLTPTDWFALPTAALAADTVPDTDGDGLDDELEALLGTSVGFGDSDQDLMPDGWEYWNGLDPLKAKDATEDPDQDGADNRTEYEKGTNPWDRISVPDDPRPDLLLKRDPEVPAAAGTGEIIELTWTVENVGAGSAQAPWEDRVFLSYDSMYDEQDIVLASVKRADPLNPGEFYRVTTNPRVPATVFPFEYFLILVIDADNALAERREWNNQEFGLIRINTPNLVPIALRAPEVFVTQDTCTVSWITENKGMGDAAPQWLSCLYLSEDEVIDTNDLLLTSGFPLERLAPGAECEVSQSFTMPHVSEGSYRLILRINCNDQLHETSFADNLLSGNVKVHAPNLVPTQLLAPAILANGQEYQVEWEVENQGSGEAVRGWITRLLLSEDTQVDATDLVITSQPTTGPLPAGERVWSTSKFVFPEGTEIGSRHYYLLQVDPPDSQVAESREDDNLLVRSYLAAATAETGVVPPNSSARVELRENPEDLNDMGVQVMNLSPQQSSEVTLSYEAANPPGAIQPGYELLDGTVGVSMPSLANGEFVMLVVRDYGHLVGEESPFELRPLRIMRRVDFPLETTGALWQPAGCVQQGMGGVRFTPAPYQRIADAPLDYLGQRGHAPDQRYVWAVVDHASHFAIGYPTSPVQPVVTSAVLLGGGRLRLEVAATAGVVLRVESTATLEGGTWVAESFYAEPSGGQPLSQLTNAGGFVPLHLEPNGAARFYRLLAE